MERVPNYPRPIDVNRIEEAAQQFAILDRTPIGQFVLSDDFVVLFWNRCLETWTGVSRASIVGSDVLTHYPNLGANKYATRLKSIFNGGPPAVFSSQLHKYIIPARLADGKFRIQHSVVTNIPAPAEGKYDALFSLQDVSHLTEALESNETALKQVSIEIEERKQVEKELEGLVTELQAALAEIKTLHGIIPICASCKKIRGDEGSWTQLEVYIRDHSQAEFSHGICPECLKVLYPDFTRPDGG